METKMVVKRVTKQEEKLVEYLRENNKRYIEEVSELGLDRGVIKVIKDIITPGKDMSLKGLEFEGMMTKDERESIESSVRRGDNIVIKGESNRGKTTLMRGIIKEIDGRVVKIEETLELREDMGLEELEYVSAITLGKMAELREGMRERECYIVVDGLTNKEREMAIESAIEDGVVPVMFVIGERGYKEKHPKIKKGKRTKVITMAERGPIRIDGIAEIGGLK